MSNDSSSSGSISSSRWTCSSGRRRGRSLSPWSPLDARVPDAPSSSFADIAPDERSGVLAREESSRPVTGDGSWGCSWSASGPSRALSRAAVRVPRGERAGSESTWRSRPNSRIHRSTSAGESGTGGGADACEAGAPGAGGRFDGSWRDDGVNHPPRRAERCRASAARWARNSSDGSHRHCRRRAARRTR